VDFKEVENALPSYAKEPKHAFFFINLADHDKNGKLDYMEFMFLMYISK
jgi:hypothetical protein